MAVMRKVNSVMFTIASVMFTISKRPPLAVDGAGAAFPDWSVDCAARWQGICFRVAQQAAIEKKSKDGG